MEPMVVILPMLYDEILFVLLGFLALFVGVRVIVRLWDLVFI